jgi:hypothetical protein
LLDSCLQIDEINAGGIYLIDEATDDMNLAIHRGLSPNFIEHASHYSVNSPNTRLVMIGQPVYKQHIDLLLTSKDEALRQENLRATALIPVKSKSYCSFLSFFELRVRASGYCAHGYRNHRNAVRNFYLPDPPGRKTKRMLKEEKILNRDSFYPSGSFLKLLPEGRYFCSIEHWKHVRKTYIMKT